MGQVMSQACRPCFTGEDIDDPFSDEPAPLAIPRIVAWHVACASHIDVTIHLLVRACHAACCYREFEDAEEVRQRSPSPVRKYVTEVLMELLMLHVRHFMTHT